jgi:hypothetical protein
MTFKSPEYGESAASHEILGLIIIISHTQSFDDVEALGTDYHTCIVDSASTEGCGLLTQTRQ